jgi:hypothetical protein
LEDFLNGQKITTQVKYSINRLLVIGSGPWSQKIKSALNTNRNQIEFTSIGARDFLHLDSTNIGVDTKEQIIWIATTPTIQFEVLNKIVFLQNKVIIEKPFATNSKELESFIQISNISQNTLYLSEPWKYSKIWMFIKNKIGEQNSLQDIVIYRGGPKIRSYINPVWDWIQHDLGLVGELLKERQDTVQIGFEWLNEGKTLRLKIISDSKFNIEINVGYFPERVEFWKINDTEVVNFNDNQFVHDQPLCTMYEYVESNGFTNDLIKQSWLTNKVIRVLAS